MQILRREVKLGTLLVLAVLLVACQEMQTPLSPQAIEFPPDVEEEVFDPTDGWVELAPSVWYREIADERGGIRRQYHAEGDEGFLWMFENVRRPAHQESNRVLSNDRAGPSNLALAQFHEKIYLASIDRYNRLAGVGPARVEQEGDFQALSCTGETSVASAMSTSAARGAKGYARAKSCTDNSYAGVQVYPAGSSDGLDYELRGPGETAYASNSVYEPTGSCWSRAYSDNGDVIDEDAYDCP